MHCVLYETCNYLCFPAGGWTLLKKNTYVMLTAIATYPGVHTVKNGVSL